MCYICKYKDYTKNKTHKDKFIITTYIRFVHNKKIPIKKHTPQWKHTSKQCITTIHPNTKAKYGAS